MCNAVDVDSSVFRNSAGSQLNQWTNFKEQLDILGDTLNLQAGCVMKFTVNNGRFTMDGNRLEVSPCFIT